MVEYACKANVAIAKKRQGGFAVCMFFQRIKKLMTGHQKKKALISQLTKAFPKHLAADVEVVCNALINTNEPRGYEFYIDNTTVWQLPSGDTVTVPYRLYIRDKLDFPGRLTQQQKLIYHCICSRSYNGYIRQKHVEALLYYDLPEWARPFVIKICDEYVIEILQIVYRKLKTKDCDQYKEICALNIDYIKRAHSRMISYWSEFYRYDCFRYDDYIGKKLYAECFGYGKTGQKHIRF